MHLIPPRNDLWPCPSQELLATNLGTCKANLETAQADIALIQESATTTEVSIARIYNYDVARRRELKEAEEAAAS